MMSQIVKLIILTSIQMNVDPYLALSVAINESNLNPLAVGSKNEQGLFQLLPKSYKKLSIKELRDIKTNVKLGVKHLKQVEKECPHKDFIICYNVGVTGSKKIKKPHLFPYVVKFNKTYNYVKYIFTKESIEL